MFLGETLGSSCYLKTVATLLVLALALMRCTRSGSFSRAPSISRIGQCFNTCLLTEIDVVPVNDYVTVSVGPRLLVPETQGVTWNEKHIKHYADRSFYSSHFKTRKACFRIAYLFRAPLYEGVHNLVLWKSAETLLAVPRSKNIYNNRQESAEVWLG